MFSFFSCSAFVCAFLCQLERSAKPRLVFSDAGKLNIIFGKFKLAR